MTTHPSILAWKILWTEKTCGLQSHRLQRELSIGVSVHVYIGVSLEKLTVSVS